jgi:hypothetical protein
MQTVSGCGSKRTFSRTAYRVVVVSGLCDSYLARLPLLQEAARMPRADPSSPTNRASIVGFRAKPLDSFLEKAQGTRSSRPTACFAPHLQAVGEGRQPEQACL